MQTTQKAFDIHVTGVVQGVGFRPFIYRLASRFGLSGWVFNALDGVRIHIEGTQNDCLNFIQAISLEAPAAAIIDHMNSVAVELKHVENFSILASVVSPASQSTLISPDLATCPDCLRELFDESDRRFGYPFINCTNCGPRFTIIEGLPYDRPLTTMRSFGMCEHCASEYHDIEDRRFHAQPNACFACGPALSLHADGVSQTAVTREQSMALLMQTVDALLAGKIVAIKGLGGYHLACDATNETAVATLRKRKQRSNKPLAVMMADLNQVRDYCQVNEVEAELLEGRVRPIVLLPWSQALPVQATEDQGITANTERGFIPIAENVCGNLLELGVMLPSTPVQHLLFSLIGRPLVMTSGNVSEEPIIGDVDLAHELLDGIAELWLDNDRPISSRYDDSVVRVVAGSVQFVRRARGYAPLPLALPQTAALNLLAVGPEQKNTFCLARGGLAYVSQHLGDLDDNQSVQTWLATRWRFEQLFSIVPEALVADMHVEYLSTKWAQSQARAAGLPLYFVQHHHAHIASVLAEAAVAEGSGADGSLGFEALADRTCIGFAFDGTGLGDDNTIWGGEIMLANLLQYERAAHLRTVAMPGGSKAIVEPWRMAFSWLKSSGLLAHPGAGKFIESIDTQAMSQLELMIEQSINSPLTSSMGRLFDAVSALLGICTQASYDGEPAVALEAIIGKLAHENESSETATIGSRYLFNCEGEVIDPAPLFKGILDDLEAGVSVAQIAKCFHDAVVNMVVTVAERLREQHQLNVVALSGGVFMNRYLIEHLIPTLNNAGFTVLTNRELPPNDGCISYGQAAVVSARLVRDISA